MNDHGTFNYLSLFTGGGGLDLGFQQAVRGARCVAALEIEAFARQVLVSRMEEGRLDPCPVYSDVAAFDGTRFRGLVDAVIGGSPCQDMSLAGARRGLGGSKSILFYEMARIIDESRPEWVLWENVLGAKKYLPAIFEEFERIGYAGKGTVIRASDVGASHQRARIFILARRVENADGERLGLWSGGLSTTTQSAESPDAGGLEHADGRGESSTARPVAGNAAGERLAGSAGGGLQPVKSAEGCVELADAESDGRDERGPTTTTSRKARSDGSGTFDGSLADSQQQQLRIESGRSSWEDGGDPSVAELAGKDVADDDDERCEGQRLGGVPIGGSPPHGNDADGRSGPQLADPSCGEWHEGHEVPERQSLAAQGSRRLADASGERLGERERERERGTLRDAPRGDPWEDSEREGCPEAPPGPEGDWSGIPARFFPSKSRVRRMVDGLADGLDPALAEDTRRQVLELEAELRAQDCWADRLRMLGNGVVPKQAAAAIRFLYAAITRSTI